MTKQSPPSDGTLLTFPCDFPLKIFGLASDEFEIATLSIIRKHVPNFTDQALHARASKQGKYLALTITVHVESKEQLDQLYIDLSSSPHILMVL